MKATQLSSIIAFLQALMILQSSISVTGFQIPHAGHQHPLYVRYRQEHIETQQQQGGPYSQAPSPSDIVKAQGTALAISEEEYSSTLGGGISPIPSLVTPPTILTPISYDEETGMVQTAVRAIVRHPVSHLVDNHVVGISSTLVIATGALHEAVHCIELDLAHHAATGSNEGLVILSIGHFFHYGREAIRQLVEVSEAKKDEESTVPSSVPVAVDVSALR